MEGRTITRRLRFSASPDAARAAVILTALVALGVAPLASVTWFDTHEGIAAWERVVAIAAEIRAGFTYPRWLSAAYGGKGSPFADFYSPMVHHTAAWLHVAGVPIFAAIKVLCGAAMGIGALGVLLWTRRHVGLAGGAAASALYLLAPYHYVDLFVRGAYSEFVALAIIPWLFLGIDLCTGERRWRGTVVVALATAGTILTHNLSAMMIAAFAGGYAAWAILGARGRGSVLAAVALGGAIGVGLSAFYWLPVIVDASSLRGLTASLTTGEMAAASHVVELQQLFDPKWGFGVSVPGGADGMSFQLGLAQAAAAAVGVLTLARTRGRTASFGAVALALAVAAVLMTTGAATSVYEAIPPLRFVQFPWRFLGPASLFLAALGGVAASDAVTAAWRRWGIAGAVAIACVVASGTWRQPRPFEGAAAYEAPDAEARVVSGGFMGALTVAGEYLPRWASPRAVAGRVTPVPVAVGGVAQVYGFAQRGALGRFDVDAGAEGATVVVPWFYFPGWEGTVDGARAALAPSPDGFIVIDVPAGRHEVALRFAETPARSAAARISLASLLALIAYAGIGARRQGRSGASEPAAHQD